VSAAKALGWNLREEWQNYLAEEQIYPVSKINTPPVSKINTPPVLKINTPVSENDTPPVSEIDTHKQTSSFKQNGPSKLETLWNSVLHGLKMQVQDSVFHPWLSDSTLESLEGGKATVVLTNPFAKDWVENRLSRQICRELSLEDKLQQLGYGPTQEIVVCVAGGN
jgi:hypothetical protein